MNFGEFANGKAQQPLPPTLAPHEADLCRFESLCHEICIKFLRLLSIALEVGNLEDFHEAWSNILRSLRKWAARIGSLIVINLEKVLLVVCFVCFMYARSVT